MEIGLSQKNHVHHNNKFPNNHGARAGNYGNGKTKQLQDNYPSESFRRGDPLNDKSTRSKNMNLSKIDSYR